MTLQQICDELLNGCPVDARLDHEAIAEMILSGASTQEILQSTNLDNWPETYVWLKGALVEAGL